MVKENESLAAKVASASAGSAVNEFVDLKGYKVLAKYFENADISSLNSIGDSLKVKYPDYIILLIGGNEGNLPLSCFVGGKALESNKAGDIIKQVSGLLGGSGGGRPNMANGRGKNKGQIDATIKMFKENIK